MYTAQVSIRGLVPLLQHRFAPAQLGTLMQSAPRRSGVTDYSREWAEGMYATADGYLYQPSSHLEGALVKAAARFKVKGGGGKTWKDPVRAYCYVLPEQILHRRAGAPVPVPADDLLTHPTEHLSVSIMRVMVQRSAVARAAAAGGGVGAGVHAGSARRPGAGGGHGGNSGRSRAGGGDWRFPAALRALRGGCL